MWSSFKRTKSVQQAFQLKPDLIILDVTMPVLYDLAAARQIRTILPKVPILMLSMHDGDDVVREARLAGVQGFVTKSEAANALLRAVDAVLREQALFSTRLDK
jgi:two-component system nitrate/nitrite response regulator NarL